MRDSTKARHILRTEFNTKVTRIYYGRGTARRWLTIESASLIPHDVREAAEKRFLDEKLCGTYYTDHGRDDRYMPCVQWVHPGGRLMVG